MQIEFVKCSGKYDQMRISRNGVTETIACPKQRIIPHDMVHYVIENALQKRGFLSRICDGELAAYRMAQEAESDGVERLVEVFQGDAWSGGDALPQDLLELYQLTCTARGCTPLAVGPEDVLSIRHAIQALDAKWQALATGQSMVLAV